MEKTDPVTDLASFPHWPPWIIRLQKDKINQQTFVERIRPQAWVLWNHRPGSALKPWTAACSPQPLTGSERTAVNANFAAGNSLKHTSRLLNRTSAKPCSPEHTTYDKERRFSAQQSQRRRKTFFKILCLTEILVDTGAQGNKNPWGKTQRQGVLRKWPLTPCSPEDKNALCP